MNIDLNVGLIAIARAIGCAIIATAVLFSDLGEVTKVIFTTICIFMACSLTIGK